MFVLEMGIEMKQCIVYICIVLLVLTACNDGVKLVSPQPKQETFNLLKKQVPATFFHRPNPIYVESGSIIEISEWLDEETVLFLKEEGQISYLQKFHLFTGEEDTFFHIAEPILSVIANSDRTLFAVQTSTSFDSPIYIVDKNGTLRFQLTEFGEDFSIYWNQYSPKDMLIVAYLPNWEFEVYQLDAEKRKIEQLPLEQTFFQWLGPRELGYLNWSHYEPSYYAPFYRYDLDKKEKIKLEDEIIAFFSYSNYWRLMVSVDTIYEMNSTYRFYQHQHLMYEMKVPILNTYSDQWWVPYHVFDERIQTFYFLRPYYSSNFFEYNDGFELVATNMATGVEKVITEVAMHAPIQLSPDGKWILYGNQKEFLIETETGTTWRLF